MGCLAEAERSNGAKSVYNMLQRTKSANKENLERPTSKGGLSCSGFQLPGFQLTERWPHKRVRELPEQDQTGAGHRIRECVDSCVFPSDGHRNGDIRYSNSIRLLSRTKIKVSDVRMSNGQTDLGRLPRKGSLPMLLALQ